MVRKAYATLGSALVSALMLAGCASNGAIVEAPVITPPAEVISEPEPEFESQPEVIAPAAPEAAASSEELEEFRQVVVDGCLAQGGSQTYCTCTFDYFASQASWADVEAFLQGAASEEQQEALFAILEAAPAACVTADADVLATFTWESIETEFMAACTTDSSEEFCSCSFSQLRDESGISEADAATVILGGGTVDQRTRFAGALQLSYFNCGR